MEKFVNGSKSSSTSSNPSQAVDGDGGESRGIEAVEDDRTEKRARTENSCDGDDKPEGSGSVKGGYIMEVCEFRKLLKDCRDVTHFHKGIVQGRLSDTTKVIVSDIGDKFFSLMIEAVSDDWGEDRVGIVVRYVNNDGVAMERLIGVFQTVETYADAESLKSCIDVFFAEQGLSMSRVRGQGYDGESAMRCGVRGLKSLILSENPCARYIHWFARELQPAIVDASMSCLIAGDLIVNLDRITKKVGDRCRIEDEPLQKEHEKMVEILQKGEILVEREEDCKKGIASGGTSWGSYYTTILRLLCFWPSTVHVLLNLYDYSNDGVAVDLIEKMETYQIVFAAHMMKLVLGVTNVLSQFLQQKNHNIIEVVSLVQNTRKKLQELKENGWDELFKDVNTFCAKNNVDILNLEDKIPSRSWYFRGYGPDTTYYHCYRVEIFCKVIDKVAEEMENRFSESNIELLTCIACLDPKDSFSNFSESKLLRLAEFYPQEFLICDQMELKAQLKVWIDEMRENERFSTVQDIGSVAKKMVEVGFHKALHLVYRLIQLVLVLPVTTATVERAVTDVDLLRADALNRIWGDSEFPNFCRNIEFLWTSDDAYYPIDQLF